MTSPMKFSRRGALGIGLGVAGTAMLPRFAMSQAQQEILVSYYGALMNTSPVAVGMEKGFYTNVSNIVTTIGGGTAIRNMVGGGLKYGMVGSSGALSAIKEGIDVKIVHGVVRTLEDLFWVTMPDSPVKTIKDLEGKKIAFTRPKSVSETMIRWMLQRNNLMGKVEMLSLGGVGAGLSALEKGAVDAALILEPLYSARKDKYRVVFTLAELPPMVQMVAVATGDFIREHPDQVKALVSAWRKSVDYTYANPGEAAELMSKRFGDKSFKLDVAQSAVQNMSKIKFWSRGEVDREGLKVWLKTMIEQGEWEGDADWDNMIDESFLDADLKA